MIFQLGTAYLKWHFLETPAAIVAAWRGVLAFGLDYFSLPLLLKTLFSPWRRYRWSYPRGFQPAVFLEVLFSNFISRVLGSIVRVGIIAVGIVGEFFLVASGLVVLFAWIALPFCMAFSFFYGLSILFF